MSDTTPQAHDRSAETVIRVENVTKRYGDLTALDGVSLTVDRGRTVGLIGTNGAGKTTLLKLLVGLDRPDAGDLSVAGVAPTAGTTVRELVGFLPEQAGFDGTLTGREVLAFHARMRSVPRSERDRRVARTLATVGLADAADRRVAGYSNGMTRRLGLGAALVGNPAVLLLDEPTAGLDPIGVDDFHAVVERVAAETDVTVVFSTHALAEVERLCERAVVIHDGVVRAAGDVDDLRRRADGGTVVRARLADGGDRDAVEAAVADRSDVEHTDRSRGRTVELTCPRADAYAVAAAVESATALDDLTVREPGLDAAFRRLVGEGGDATATGTSRGTGGEPE